MNFRPGTLTTPDAQRLNEMWAELRRWMGLKVAFPLGLTRGAGSVVINAGSISSAVTLNTTPEIAGAPPGTVAVLDPTGGPRQLQLTPMVIEPGVNTVTQYLVPAVGNDPATSPVIQYTVDNTGTPTITQLLLTDGTSGGNGITETLTPTQHTVSYTLNSQTGGYTVTESGGNIVYTYVAGTTVDFSAATVTGIADTNGTLAALGSVQGDAALIVDDATEVTGADGTKGVRLPDVPGIRFVWNSNATNSLKVYPPSGAGIGLGAVNANSTVGAKAVTAYARLSAVRWTSWTVTGTP